jgi:hypothetical protein
MVQLINQPTHTATTPSGTITENVLDLIITDSPGYVKSVDVLPPLGSHHATLYLEFSITYPRDKTYIRHIWDYDKGDYDRLNSSISRYPWDDILTNDLDLDSKATTWTEAFLDLCKDCVPNRSIQVRPKDLPWITTDCKRLIRDCNRSYKRFKRSKAIADEAIWKTKAKVVRATLNISRLNYREKMKETLSNPGLAPKKYWSLIKRIYGNKKGMGVPVLEVGSKQLTTSSEKAIAFTDFFCRQQTLTEPAAHHLPPLTMLTNQRLGDISTSPEEVNKILGSLELGKAHGVDGVSVRLLKETAESLKRPLSKLINVSFSSGKVPTTWKRANVSPVHKKDCRSTVGNYRPISLLSTLAKVQERIVYRKLYTFLSTNGLLTPKNSGFKEKDSAMCQLINIVDKIYKALENGKEITMVFLDITKAFHKIWHKGLLHKLKSNGIEGNLLNWLEDYLYDRKIRVVINGQCAPWATTNAGVPQGSILGPLLFLVFM